MPINKDQPLGISATSSPRPTKELRSMQMCAVDKDLKREDAVDAVLLSTCAQHRLRLDIQLDLNGGGVEGDEEEEEETLVCTELSQCKLFDIIAVMWSSGTQAAETGLVTAEREFTVLEEGRSNN